MTALSADDNGAGKPAPFVVSVLSDGVEIRVTCQTCGRVAVIRAPTPLPGRVFLKSYLRGGQPELDGVSVHCAECTP